MRLPSVALWARVPDPLLSACRGLAIAPRITNLGRALTSLLNPRPTPLDALLVLTSLRDRLLDVQVRD